MPDISGDGYSEQEDIMTAICTAKGAIYDGIDCVGELNNATLTVSSRRRLTTRRRDVSSVHESGRMEPCAR